MVINREAILAGILKHKSHFFRFVDVINANETALQFPMTAYLKFYEQVIYRDDDYALKDILSVEALLQANVFVNIDGLTNMVTLSKDIYNILVWLDISRKKQLDSQPFESHRQDVVRLANELTTLPIEGINFKETYAFFYEKLSDIQVDISENMRVLDYRVDEIADMYKSREMGSLETGLDELFHRAQHVYHRNITPCLEFINPSLELKGTKNLSETLKDLEHYFEEIGEVDKARTLQFRVGAIFCYYKDIRAIASRLNAYLVNLAQEREFFLSMERAFGVLVESLVPLRHGRHQNKYLNADSEVFKLATTFDGLEDHKKKYEKRFNYSPSRGLDHFNNYYEMMLRRPLKQKLDNPLRALPLEIDIEEERCEQILSITLYEIAVDNMIENVQRYVWQKLQELLPNAGIIDFLYALEYFLSALDDACVSQRRNDRDRIDDGVYYLDYIIWDYAEASL